MSYKFENKNDIKPVLVAVCVGLTGSFPYGVYSLNYYKGEEEFKEYNNSYTMNYNTIMFSPRPGPDHTGKPYNISGNYLVRVFLILRDDLSDSPYNALSNVVQLKMKF